MKTLDRRLRRLEDRFVPQANREELRLAFEIRESRSQRYESEGRPFVEPLEIAIPPLHRRLTIAESIKRARAAPRGVRQPLAH